LQSIQGLLHFETNLLCGLFALKFGLALRDACLAHFGAPAAAIEERPIEQYRNSREIPTSAESVLLALGTAVDTSAIEGFLAALAAST